MWGWEYPVAPSTTTSQTVLVVSELMTHQSLYEIALRGAFNVRFTPTAVDGNGTVAALVYDIPKTHVSKDIEWLEAVEQPIVVLTPEDSLPLAEKPNRKVLTYPVSAEDLLKALAELGVGSA